MNKEELINNCISVLGGVQDRSIIELVVKSALAYVNSYTFQGYSLDRPDLIPQEVFFAIIEIVKFKMTQKLGIQAEKLSDYAITYTSNELPISITTLLDPYRIINVI